jgi:hypothetical protein
MNCHYQSANVSSEQLHCTVYHQIGGILIYLTSRVQCWKYNNLLAFSWKTTDTNILVRSHFPSVCQEQIYINLTLNLYRNIVQTAD